MAENKLSKFEEYNASIMKRSEELIFKGLLEKVVELNELLSTPMFANTVNPGVDENPISFEMKNPLTDMVEVIKPILTKMIEDCKLLRMWLNFLIPKIESGNNTGVEVQKCMLLFIKRIQFYAVATLRDVIQSYFVRAEIISKVLKYPEIHDYRLIVQKLDKGESMSSILFTVRDAYLILHDKLIKNMEKLKNPRSEAFEF